MQENQPRLVRPDEKTLGDFLEYLANSVRKPGPVAWHSRCSRYHRRGERCDLRPVTRWVNGKQVTRYAHPEKKKPYQRKKRVRKS